MKDHGARIDAACAKLDRLAGRLDALGGARADGERMNEKTVTVKGRSFKIHQERKGPGDSWVWRYEAGTRSSNAMREADLIKYLERIVEYDKTYKSDSAPVSRRDRIAATLGRCDQLMKRVDAMSGSEYPGGPSGLRPGYSRWRFTAKDGEVEVITAMSEAAARSVVGRKFKEASVEKLKN